jgi:hypothetical protein
MSKIESPSFTKTIKCAFITYFSWFINDRFSLNGIQFGDDIMARFTSQQNPSHGSWTANNVSLALFVIMYIAHVHAMALARVHNEKRRQFSGNGKYICAGFHRTLEFGDIVAEHFTKPTRQEKVAL